MREGDIRAAVVDRLWTMHADEPDTLIREELGLCTGQTRVDVAAINGEISGYEIKSERDTLARLRGQVGLYGHVLDRACVVTAPNHLDAVTDILPSWWAVWIAECGEVVEVRSGGVNPAPDPLAIAQLLWRDEAMAALTCRQMSAGMSRATRWQLWDRIAELPLVELQAIVRYALKNRVEWPSRLQPAPGGARSRSIAM